jgi:hypothetical protein
MVKINNTRIARSPVLQNLVNKLRAEGNGYINIANALKEKGYDISFMAVKRYLDNVKGRKQEIFEQDRALQSYVKERIFDTGEQLRKANMYLWDLIEESKTSKRFKLSVLKEVRSTIKLASELMNEFKGLKVEQGANSKVQLIQVVVNKLQDLEKAGDIKILNPRLKTGGVKYAESTDRQETGNTEAAEQQGEESNNLQQSE